MVETMKTEKQKMIAGELYDAGATELISDRKLARKQMTLINGEKDRSKRSQLLKQTFGSSEGRITIEPTFSFDYGFNIHVGKDFYANFNNIFLDVCPIYIGDNCMFGPNVQLYTAAHPLEFQERNKGLEYGKPITIGNNVWLGGGTIIIPGVKLGDNVVVAAGSVVTKSFPADCVIGGNPAKMIKKIETAEIEDPLMKNRMEINQIDKKIIQLLEQRMSIVSTIASIKKERKIPILDTNREGEVIEIVREELIEKDYEESILAIFQSILTQSKEFQKKLNQTGD
ncbi:chorismate mutase [Melissococcus plutonius]|uniref:Acetyltransferase n=1 Tax=Melissococcus plutonius TaxID=33970 RepID=A0A2Z5Y0U8_9ENTE|nr:chorismate mutase [Melissococcus plutonius]BAL61546.1 maltose O-acetyltransferase [Melissococcus plutonius DAT561]MCV2499279.1 chorismate mutase [Melissococcus plutonius]MCV2501183.1 chorismate mutase [Melissococcus plutonius]MCV2505459.1 chorismate mutase [Melissococcus plutonius]MCV2507819.1 chorismate mutase [Melissococcus plutonius]